jgi:hypothetical protein
MAERRAACHLPDSVHHRPKWQLLVLVLDMLDVQSFFRNPEPQYHCLSSPLTYIRLGGSGRPRRHRRV